MNATPLGLEQLEAVSAKDAALQNAVTSAIARRLYQIAGQSVMFGLADGQTSEVLKVALQFNGQNIVLGLSQSLVDALLKGKSTSLTNLNVDILNLIARLKLVPVLPQGTELKGFHFGNESTLDAMLQALPKQVSLRAMTAAGEPMTWEIAIYALSQTSLGAFLKGFDAFVTQRIPSPLLKAKVPMLIVAAKTSVPAEQMRDLALGDVILFG